MINIDGIPGRTALVNGKTYLFFSGFAYLGMPSLEAFRDILSEGIKHYGSVFPSSRISNTQSLLYEQFEDHLSRFIGLPASATFSSGYLASQAAVHAAARDNNLIYAPGVHPSLQVIGRGEMMPPSGQWQQQVIEMVNQGSGKIFTLVMESVNPLSGEVQDFMWLKQISEPIELLIDDSHGIGVLGQAGEGIISALPKTPFLNPVISYSLSKAFSCEGGGVSASEEMIARIRKTAYYTASTPISPVFAYAWMQAQDLFKAQRMTLTGNIALLAERVSEIPSLKQDTRLPVCRVLADGLYEYCLEYHILLSAFRYPSQKDPLSSRIVLNALHQKRDIERLVDCILSFRS